MDYRCVVAIDAGYRNFAWCCVDRFSWKQPLHWRLEDLWPRRAGRRAKPQREDIIRFTMDWCQDHEDELKKADVIVLEKQMRVPFIVQNTVFRVLFPEKVRMVHAMTVGAYFKLPKTRDKKKAAAVEFLQVSGIQFPRLPRYKKKDDLADAWLMAVYQLQQEGQVEKDELFEVQ